jgi:hypothetical protein
VLHNIYRATGTKIYNADCIIYLSTTTPHDSKLPHEARLRNTQEHDYKEKYTEAFPNLVSCREFVRVDIREVRQDGMVWIGLMWLRIGTSGGLL